MNAPYPPDEARRLAALHALEVLDTAPDAGLDALAACAARLSGCPIALISLVDADRIWFKARVGLAVAETTRDPSFCAHAIAGEALFEVADALADARFRDHPLVVAAPYIRFYAGQPLVVQGQNIGTLCVLDPLPRRLDAHGRETLAQLASAASALLGARRRAFDDLGQRERLLDFARAGGDWMWESDAEHRYRWIGGAFEAHTGLDPQALIGLQVPDATALDARGHALPGADSLRALLQAQQPFARIVAAEPTPRGLLYLSRSAVPVFDAAGRFAGFRGTTRDVSAAVLAAAEAERSEATLRRLAGQVPGVLFTYRTGPDGQGSYEFVSDSAQRAFGMSAAELRAAPNSFFDRVHADDLPALSAALAEHAATLQPLAHTYRLRAGDTGWRMVESRIAPLRLPDGGTLWHGFTADITARQATESALRESEARWHMAAEAASIGIAELMLADGILRLDRQACTNYGLPFPLSGFTLEQWAAQIDPADRDAATAGVAQALASDRPVEGRYRVYRPDGQLRWLEFVMRRREDAAGRITGVIGTCRDVHEQQTAAELQRGKHEAERASRAKTEFLSRVSHELRTPLNGILGFAQVMALDREHPLAPPQAARLASVRRAGRHLLGLINEVLEVSRIESGELTLRSVPVALDAALRGSMALVEPLAEDRSVRLQLPPPSGAWVRGDPRAIEQVLMNLLSNAIKYSPERSRVEVQIQPEAAEIAIAVRDQGAGLSPAQLTRLFQPFDRLGAERQRVEGSGLGLVIVRQLLQAMGGRIEVGSAPGIGSVFTVRLAAASAEDDAGGAVSEPAPLGRMPEPSVAVRRRVIYVEDEPLNRLLMEEVFRARPDWDLELAFDGAEGLRLAGEQAPDLMLVDMNLPDMSGLELIGRLHAEPPTRRLRCIALSADAMGEQVRAALASGCDDYWTKPIDVNQVLAGLDALLARRA